MRPKNDREDVIWHWESNCIFSIRSTYRNFNDGVSAQKMLAIWSTKCSEKVRVLLWLISKKAILIWPKLHATNWLGLNICVLCMKNAESLEHILLTCECTNALRAKFASVFSLSFDMTAQDDVWGRVWVDRKTNDF